MTFKDKNVVLIITGGVAAYKSAIFARLLIKAGATVKTVMTKAATEFITPLTMHALTKQPVLTDLFTDHNDAIPHITVADWADYVFVVPATANMIAKMANGIADEAASTVLAATHAPVIVAPAMNVHMYEQKATQRNLAQLKEDGVIVIEPAEGMLAEGYVGKGRLPEPEDILKIAQLKLQVRAVLATEANNLKKKRVLVTAGGTNEPIDPVRFITNRSSGKMGYALAQAASEVGAEVTLISTVDLPVPVGVQIVKIQTAKEMLNALNECFNDTDVVIMAAAVADYRIASPADQKIKKSADSDGLTLHLVENPDILATLGAAKTHQFLVGFAADTQDLLAAADKKLLKKNADMLIANDVSQPDAGFGVETNRVTILEPNKAPQELPLQSKLAVARQIVGLVADRLVEKEMKK